MITNSSTQLYVIEIMRRDLPKMEIRRILLFYSKERNCLSLLLIFSLRKQIQHQLYNLFKAESFVYIVRLSWLIYF